MMKWLAALMLAPLAVVPPQILSAQTVQDDTRLRGLDGANEALVWQAVGRLDSEDIGFCTATLIAPELVLTAAHCVYSPDTGALLDPDDLTFKAGLRKGRVAAERGIAQIEAHPGYTPNGRPTLENIRHDVALLRLEQPIPTHELDPFILHENEVSNGPVSVVSYGRGRENLPSWQNECRLLGARQGVLLMNCDVTFGSSGAPVFSHVNGRGQIVSIISGIGRYQGRRVSYGMPLPELVADLRYQMRANSSGPVAEIKRVQAGSRLRVGASGGAKFVRPGGS